METPAPGAQIRLAARVGWLVLILTTLYLCYFRHLGAIGLVGPDEPRYAWIARAMVETGDWVTPRLHGKPWFEKPPLYYWGAALSFKFFGVSEAAARLPSAVCAVLATLALAWLALRLYGGETARWLLLLVPTTVGMTGFSHAAATDMPFSAMLTIVMVAAAVLLRLVRPANAPSTVSELAGSRDRPRPWPASPSESTVLTAIFFGFFLGLAVLAKGPAGVILSGGGVFFWALITKRWRDALRLFHPAGLATFCATALPWYILCARRNPDFFRIFLIEHNFKRFLTPEFQHLQPFWFYGEILLLAFLPWTAGLLWTFLVGLGHLRRRRSLSAPTAFLLSWTGFCLVFFTISRSKLPGYILPAVPAIGLLLCRAAVSLASARRRSFGWASLVAAILYAGACAAVSYNDARLLKNLVAFAPLVVLILLALAGANGLLGVFYLFSRPNAARVASVLPILLLFAVVDVVLPFTPASVLSPRYLADQLQADQVPLAELRVADIRRGTLYGLNFYLRSDLQEWNRDPSRESFLLTTGGLPCAKIPAAMHCSNVWGGEERIERFALLHLTPGTSAPQRHR